MDVLQKLRQLQQERGWSDYRIAKEAKLSPNTVSNIFRRGTLPSVSTLEALCGAFGITVAQFFDTQKAAVLQVMRSYRA